jgi:hypothetical protein
MDDPETYKRYAAECKRMAQAMLPTDRKVMLEIAEAWLTCAKNAEAKSRPEKWAVQQLDKYILHPANQSGSDQSKENTTLNESKWKNTLIKGFRISPSLLAMVESECRARNTHFSEFIRYALVATMKRGRYAAVAE